MWSLHPHRPHPPLCCPLPLGPEGSSQVPALRAALWDPRGGSFPCGLQGPTILLALLTGRGAAAWRPLGVHDGFWASPGDSSDCLRPAY